MLHLLKCCFFSGLIRAIRDKSCALSGLRSGGRAMHRACRDDDVGVGGRVGVLCRIETLAAYRDPDTVPRPAEAISVPSICVIQ